MTDIVAFNLAKVTPQDSVYFTGLAREFERNGASFALFSPGRADEMKRFTHGFDWVIGNISKRYPLDDVNLRHRLTKQQREKWITRVSTLALQRPEDTPEAMVDILERFANYVLREFDPKVVLSWNTLCPHSGILAEIARPLGVKVYMMERAFLDSTWFLEPGGLVGHSIIVDKSLEELVDGQEESCNLIGSSYLEANPFHAMARYAQKQGKRLYEILRASRTARRPVLAFLPPDDLSLGFRPTEDDDRRKHLPGYDNSIEAAIALAEAAPHCDVIFKPHPSFLEMRLPDKLRDNLFVVDHDYREVIAKSDVMVSTGTGLVANALSIGKPVLQMNRDQFLNKGITYEALTAAEIPAALEAALAEQDLPQRLERYRTFIGYCLQHYLVSSPTADAAFRRPVDVVREIVEQNISTVRPQRAPATEAPNLSNNRLEMFRTLRTEEQASLLVDLDHTLLFGNTTELFLDSVRPRTLFLMVHWLLQWLMPWSSLAADGIRKDQILDPLRVFLCAVLAPWSLILWRLRAPGLVQKSGNKTLISHLLQADPKRVIVVTNGHPWLVRPIVRAMGLGKASLVCGNVLPTRTDIRRIGKIADCSRRLPLFRPGRCIAISDSHDDIQMLTRARQGFLIDWRDAKTKADPFAHYFPFVLTTEGKYPKARVVRRHRFKEDFPVILIAFALAGIGLSSLGAAIAAPAEVLPSLLTQVVGKAVALFFLFISFNVVYEIGYWDNDFIAAANEDQPNVSAAMERFRTYPIRRGAWTWGVVLGLLGTMLVALGGHLTALPFHDLVMQQVSAPWAALVVTWALAFGLWIITLIVTRKVFDLHNTLPESGRIYSFYLLHALKLLAYAVLLPIALAGVILVISQIYRHWLGYAVYRFKGHKDDVPRMQVRGFFFLVLSAIFALAVPPASLFDLSWFFGAVLLLAGPDGFRLPRRVPDKQS